jgi:hypothetical protein
MCRIQGKDSFWLNCIIKPWLITVAELELLVRKSLQHSAWSELEFSMYKVTVTCALRNMPVYQERQNPQLSQQHTSITVLLLITGSD